MGSQSVNERRELCIGPYMGTWLRFRNGLPRASGETLTEDSLPILYWRLSHLYGLSALMTGHES